MLTEMDIIQIHQTTKDFTIWYHQSINKVSKYVGHAAALRLIQFSILESLDEILIPDPIEVEGAKCTMMEVYDAIFSSVSENNYMENIYSYIRKDESYFDFMVQYRLNRFLKVEDTGRYWIKLVDSLYDDSESTIALLDDLIPFISWTFSYSFAFASQYLIENPGNVEINRRLFDFLNYWELKELEHKLDIYPKDCFSSGYKYVNREELLYDFVNHGIFLPKAVKITRRIRRGRGVTDEQKKELLLHGIESVEDLEKIRYLTSISNTFFKVFRVNKLI